MSKRWRQWSLVAGVALLLGAPAGWHLLQPPTTVGDLPSEFTPGTAAPESSAAGPATAEVPGVADIAAADQGEPVRWQPTPAPPVALTIEAIGVRGASIVDVGLDERGAVSIPDDVRQVGWYRRGPRPGEAGNAFMTSHVDSRTQGRGVLFDLRRLEPGDRISVEHADGSTSQWEVARRERIEKGTYPFEQVFRFDGPPGLVIDTCGGSFDPVRGSYDSIDIVFAVPV